MPYQHCQLDRNRIAESLFKDEPDALYDYKSERIKEQSRLKTCTHTRTISTYVCMCGCIYMYVCVCVYIYIHVWMYVYVCTYVLRPN